MILFEGVTAGRTGKKAGIVFAIPADILVDRDVDFRVNNEFIDREFVFDAHPAHNALHNLVRSRIISSQEILPRIASLI